MNGRNGAIHSAPQHAAPAGCQNMKNSKLFSARVASTILVLLAAFVLVPQAMAQMPAAGTKIGNSAKATYTDPGRAGENGDLQRRRDEGQGGL